MLSILAHASPSPLNCVNQNWAQGCHRVRSFPIISTPWTLWVFVVFPQEGHHFGLNELGQETTARRHCLERALGVGDVVSHGCYNECIMSVTFLDLNAFCQNRLCYLVIIISNSVDSSMNFNCFRARSHIKKTTDQRGSACASGAGCAKVLGIKEIPGSSAWGAAKCGIAVPRKLYGGVELSDGTR